jgi:hypothetical protein
MADRIIKGPNWKTPCSTPTFGHILLLNSIQRGTGMREKRKLERVRPNPAPDILDRDSMRVVGHLVDITSEGVMLQNKDPFKPETVLHLRMSIPTKSAGHKEIDFDAECKWCMASSDAGGYYAGLQLLNPVPGLVELMKLLVEETSHKVGR